MSQPNKNLHLVISDMHYPYVDKECEKEVLDEVKASRPKMIHALGDIIDCYSISKHRRDPDRRGDLQDDLDSTRDFLVKLRKAAPTGCEIRFTEGNHEERLRKYLCDIAPELHCLDALRMPALLNLKDLGIKWFTSHQPYHIADWWFVHGDIVRKHAGYSVRAKAESIGSNVIMGHTHRMAMVPVTTWSRSSVGVENGCLCSLDCEFVQGRPNWQQGFTLLHWDSRCQSFHPQLKMFRDVVSRGRAA